VTGRQPRPQDGEASQRGPPRALLAAEFPRRLPGLRESAVRLPVQERGLGQQQPRFGQGDLPMLVLELPDGFLGGLAGLRYQAHRQQQLAPVGEQLTDRRAVGTEAPLGLVEVVQRGRHVTTQATDPAEILVHESQREIQPGHGAQARGLVQVTFRGGKLLPVSVQDCPVGQHPLHPHMIGGTAQHRQRGLIVGKSLLKPAELIQDRAALRLSSRLRHAGQVSERRFDLTQGLPRPSAHIQGKCQRHPGFAGEFGRAHQPAEPDRGTQMP
jgi:hypothetical protein